MAMSSFVDSGVFLSDNFRGSEDQTDNRHVQRTLIKKKLRDFLREFYVTTEGGVTYAYRDQLKQNYNLGEYWVEVDLGHLASYDNDLADCLTKQPIEYHPLFEQSAKEVADEVTRPRPEDEEVVHSIRVLLQSNALPTSVRSLKADMMSKIVKIPGIIVSATAIHVKAIKLGLECKSCRATINTTTATYVKVEPGFEGYTFPKQCVTEAQEPCPLDPFLIVPKKCECVDFQTLKLQEAPDAVPQGEMPRHLQLYIDRYLCDKVVSGNRVTVIGIYTNHGSSTSKSKDRGGSRGICVETHKPYLRVLGVEAAAGTTGHSMVPSLTPEEEEKIHRLAQNPNICDIVRRSIAPFIFESSDIRKAVACLLFGGSRERLPDGLTRRGDMNMLMLGDPGTAKLQLLKFVEQVSPIDGYTSGKVSSASGLTATVIKDPSTKNFIMESGAMVLANGGVVCIDEFDKMGEDYGVAIHEAIEQQTISISKSGITSTLDSRSVLAAANSVCGRRDDSKAEQNIDFIPTILSRFDMIFIMNDTDDQAQDITLAKHVMGVHMTAQTAEQTATEGEIDLQTLKKYIAYARNKCGPRFSAGAYEKLKNCHISMRAGAHSHGMETEKKTSIPITVRPLQAIVRMSESLAKMKLAPFAGEAEVDEAVRLFQVSTLDAAMTGNLAGVEGFISDADHEMLNQIEKEVMERLQVQFDAEEDSSNILDETFNGEENYDGSDASLSGDESEEEDFGEELEEATSSTVNTPTSTPKSTSASRRRARPQQNPAFKWVKVLPQRTIQPFGGGGGVTTRAISASSSPLDSFVQFFTVQVLSLIVEMTNLNAEKKLEDINAQRKTHGLDPLVFQPISVEEIKVFMGLVIAMGIVKMPDVAMYWQKQDQIFDLPSFNEIIPRDRFRDISRFLHFCNEADAPPREDPMRDKLYKLRPLLNLVEPRLMSVYRPRREISIDESLISFKGRVSFRQTIKTKRARFGVKVWVLAESKTGYVSRIQFYTGKDPHAAPEVGQATRVVNDLIAPFENLNHHLYLDNFFSSPDLFASLLERGVYACGTVRTNRNGFPNDLMINRVAKIPRGFSDWRASGQLLAQSWVDNRVVYFLSTIHEPEYPANHSGQKFVKRRGGRGVASGGTEYPCPPLLADYNTHMGGVDLADQMRKYHNMTRKSKAWYRRIFSYILEITVHNARVVCEDALGKRWDGLQFRRQLVNELISDFRSTRKPSRRLVKNDVVPRLQLGYHFPRIIGEQRVCVVCSKRNQMATTSQKLKSVSRSTIICKKCDVHLCVKQGKTCFEDYHEKVEYWR